jgi:hypothetical protein
MKYELIICCKLSPLQEEIYRHLLKRNGKTLAEDGKSETGGMSGTTLAFITDLVSAGLVLVPRVIIIGRALEEALQPPSTDLREMQE